MWYTALKKAVEEFNSALRQSEPFAGTSIKFRVASKINDSDYGNITVDMRSKIKDNAIAEAVPGYNFRSDYIIRSTNFSKFHSEY